MMFACVRNYLRRRRLKKLQAERRAKQAWLREYKKRIALYERITRTADKTRRAKTRSVLLADGKRYMHTATSPVCVEETSGGSVLETALAFGAAHQYVPDPDAPTVFSGHGGAFGGGGASAGWGDGDAAGTQHLQPQTMGHSGDSATWHTAHHSGDSHHATGHSDSGCSSGGNSSDSGSCGSGGDSSSCD